jgi:hypothetical protein
MRNMVNSILLQAGDLLQRQPLTRASPIRYERGAVLGGPFDHASNGLGRVRWQLAGWSSTLVAAYIE